MASAVVSPPVAPAVVSPPPQNEPLRSSPASGVVVAFQGFGPDRRVYFRRDDGVEAFAFGGRGIEIGARVTFDVIAYNDAEGQRLMATNVSLVSPAYAPPPLAPAHLNAGAATWEPLNAGAAAWEPPPRVSDDSEDWLARAVYDAI